MLLALGGIEPSLAEGRGVAKGGDFVAVLTGLFAFFGVSAAPSISKYRLVGCGGLKGGMCFGAAPKLSLLVPRE